MTMQAQPTEEEMDLLVAYALEILEPEEIERVTKLLRERPQLQHTLAELRQTTDLLPYALPDAAPAPDLRQRTLDRALNRASAPNAPEKRLPVARSWRGWLFGLGGLASAAFALAVAAFIQVGTLQNELATTQRTLATAQAYQEVVAQVVAQPIALAELSGASGRATVLRTTEGEVLVAAQLPTLPAERVYQLWLIEGQGAPVSTGIFQVNREGYGLITLNPGRSIAGATLAITNEPAPGSPGPTTDVLLAGVIET
jgi:anti-sigma-K factor RskA